MASADTIRTVIGIIGNVITFLLFGSPVPTFWRIIKNKSTEEFKPDPYIITVVNCVAWVFYGLPIVHPHSILVVTINGIGLAMQITYLTIFFIYTTKGRRLKMLLCVFAEALIIAVLIVVALLKFHTHTSRSNFVGTFCVVVNVLMYFSPLTIMRKVITTKSVEFMPFYLSLTNFLNGAVWLTFALLRFDLYLTIGNGLGVFSGAVQLILYALYYGSTPKNSGDDKKPGSLQLSSNPSSAQVAV